MSKAAAFTATFSDLKTIKTRSVVSFHFEVAIEQADQALAILGGLPKSGAEIHVAIARLQPMPGEGDIYPARSTEGLPAPHSSGGGAPSQAREAPSEPEEPTRKVDTTKSERAKAAYRMSDDGERAVTRAAMLCEDERFRMWASRRANGGRQYNWTVGDCAVWMRGALGDIATRGLIASDERAYAAFLALEAEYKLATGQMAEIR